MDANKILEFLSSKWFMVILSLAMLAFLPITYGNLIIVYKANMLTKLWYIPLVFLMNLFSAMMAIYKAIGLFVKKKDVNEPW